MLRRFFPIRSGNHTGASSATRRRRRRSLSLERLDERILLSSSPIGGAIGPIALVQTQPTQVAEVKPGATSGLQSATSTSLNWSGYVAESNLSTPQTDSVTGISGSWVVPTVTGVQGTSSDSSVWVGIDGWNGSTVEQVGTEQDFSNGVKTYRAWWEMYSTVDQQPEQGITGMPISPGDSISASVQYMTSGTPPANSSYRSSTTAGRTIPSPPMPALLRTRIPSPYAARPSGSWKLRRTASLNKSMNWRTSEPSSSPMPQPRSTARSARLTIPMAIDVTEHGLQLRWGPGDYGSLDIGTVQLDSVSEQLRCDLRVRHDF